MIQHLDVKPNLLIETYFLIVPRMRYHGSFFVVFRLTNIMTLLQASTNLVGASLFILHPGCFPLILVLLMYPLGFDDI